ncbi:MliC family protein [Luteimonas sp. gir]|uniref:MliC family protein n=1 Tax=Luteimonas sp. gir TaxID=3127960 RepID=UPI003075D392
MRHAPPLLIAVLGFALAGCSPAQAPADDTVPPPSTDASSAAMTPPDPETPSTDAAPIARVVHYDCEGTQVDATFDGRGQASVAIDGGHVVLRTESDPAMQGARYADDQGTVLWTRGANDAILLRSGHPDRVCTGTPGTP